MSSGDAGAHTEIEAKFDVGTDTPVPELTGSASIVASSAPDPTHPSSTYFDTADLDLARRRITVRRRTGSSDAGWHVKMPVSKDERLELRSPLSAGGNNSRVPSEVAERVSAHVRGKALVPVATIETRRIVTILSTKHHDNAAELCDDTVTAHNLLDDVTVTWREWEVELLDGDRKILRKVSKHLLSHGAHPASSTSKLARALGPRLTDTDAVPARDGTAGAAVLAALSDDISALLAADPRVRQNADDAVHAMRVATRRLRSVLRSYRKLLDREAVDTLRSELSWLADILGTARDAEVLAARYRSALDSLEDRAVRGPIVESLVGTQERLYALAHEEIVRELDGRRYFALLNGLDALLAAPTVGPSDAEAPTVFRKVLRAQFRTVEKAEARASSLTGAEHEEAVHDIRKAAKKLRYAAEAASTAIPSGRFHRTASAVASSAKKVQSVLGDHQDSAVSRDTLLLEAASAAERGEDTFTFGVLFANETAAGREAVAPLPRAWKKLRRTASALSN